MKAFVWKIHKFVSHDGKVFTTLREGRISPVYQRLENLCRYFLNNQPKGSYYVEVYYNWNNRYGSPDKAFVYERGD